MINAFIPPMFHKNFPFMPTQLGLPDHQPLQYTALGVSLNGSGTALSHQSLYLPYPHTMNITI